MGVVEVALFLEVAHRVANGGRGERVAELLRNSPAPRRLGGFDVSFDNGLQDLALALVPGPCHVTPAISCSQFRPPPPGWSSRPRGRPTRASPRAWTPAAGPLSPPGPL